MKFFQKMLHLALLLICIILQVTFVGYLNIFYISLDLVMIAVLGITVYDGDVYGIIAGFFAGLVLDLMIGQIIGINAFLFALNAFAAGLILRMGFEKKLLVNILLIFSVTEINLLFLTGLYYLFNFKVSFNTLGLELLTNPFFNILAMFAIFPVLRAGRKRKEEIGFIYKDKT
jgi:rod shape-determining protein MreD